ncbi:hypothetical protein, partial [Streptomyces sp. NPDC088270]|uniref:hypothetical protein n=1 Tax=Streptomyces sp. NPDC088270 TaxID=3160990 RepID=UPI0034159C36
GCVVARNPATRTTGLATAGLPWLLPAARMCAPPPSPRCGARWVVVIRSDDGPRLSGLGRGRTQSE